MFKLKKIATILFFLSSLGVSIMYLGINTDEILKSEEKAGSIKESLRRIITQKIEKKLVVSKSSRPNLKILIAGNSKSEDLKGLQFASLELKKHLDMITGANFQIISFPSELGELLPIILEIDLSSSISKEGFKVSVNDLGITLKSPTTRGLIYAVYDLLESFGVSWFVPGSLGTIIPERKSLSIPYISWVDSPAFKMRGVEYGLWGLRQKNNFNIDAKFPFFNEFYPPLHISTMDYFISHEDYYPKQSGYFALVDGSRDPTRFLGDTKHYWKLETTNPDVVDTISESMCKHLEENPNTKYLLLSPLDGLNFSESIESRKKQNWLAWLDLRWERHTSQYLDFYSKIAIKLSMCNKDAKVVGYLYHHYNCPTFLYSSILPENLDLMVAHYNAFDMSRAVNDSASEGNKYFNKCLSRLEKISRGDIFIFEYYWKLNWLGAPWPISKNIASDIVEFSDRGYGGVLTQSDLIHNGWTLGLNFYIASKLLWDPTLDSEELHDSWINGLFDESAAPMKSYYEALGMVMNSMGVDVPGRADIHGRVVFDDKVMGKASKAIFEAKKMSTKSKTLKRIVLVEKSFVHLKKIIQILEVVDKNPKQAAYNFREYAKELRENPELSHGVVSPQVFEYIENMARRFE